MLVGSTRAMEAAGCTASGASWVGAGLTVFSAGEDTTSSIVTAAEGEAALATSTVVGERSEAVLLTACGAPSMTAGGTEKPARTGVDIAVAA